MKPIMKPIFAALAGASLLAAPVVASAQHSGGHRGGGFHGGGSFHGGGFHGGSFRGGGFHGGFNGRGFHGRGFRGGAPFVGGLGLGLAFGAAYPWYYDGPDYGYYPDYAPDYAYGAPPAQACGSWSWDPARGRYDWLPC